MMINHEVRLFCEAIAQGGEGETFPVIIVRSGLSKFPVGLQDGGTVEPVYVYWTPARVNELKEKLEERETLKSYMGHVTEEQLKGKMHRDLTEWVGTLQGPYEIKPDAKGVMLIGQYRAHGDNEYSKLLASRVKEAPSEIKFSLDYSASLKPAKRDGVAALEVTGIGRLRSLDWVPEAGFDNGIYKAEETMQCVMASYNQLRSIKEEVAKMTWQEFKELHPAEAAKALQSAQEEQRKEYEAKIREMEVKMSTVKNVDFRETDEYKAMVQANAALKEQVEALAAENKDLTKKHAIGMEQRASAYAEELKQGILDKSGIPAGLHEKVRSMVDWHHFAKEAEGFSEGSEAVGLFVQAFSREITSWEEELRKMPRTNGVILDMPKEDKLTQSDKDAAEYGKNLARMVGPIRSDEKA